MKLWCALTWWLWKRTHRHVVWLKGPRRGVCSECGAFARYVEKHDMYACAECDAWLEPSHTADDCRDCPFPPAPKRPSVTDARVDADAQMRIGQDATRRNKP